MTGGGRTEICGISTDHDVRGREQAERRESLLRGIFAWIQMNHNSFPAAGLDCGAGILSCSEARHQ